MMLWNDYYKRWAYDCAEDERAWARDLYAESCAACGTLRPLGPPPWERAGEPKRGTWCEDGKAWRCRCDKHGNTRSKDHAGCYGCATLRPDSQPWERMPSTAKGGDK